MNNNSTKDKSVIRRFLDNLHTREEGLSVYDKIREPGSENIFQDVSEEVWEEAMLSQSVTDLDYLKYKEEAQTLLKKIEPAHRFRRVKKILYTCISAASVILLLLGGFFFVRDVNKPKTVYVQVSTVFGETKNVILPDGTEIILNACSSLHYPEHFTGDERRVELTGEAYIHAARNEAKPFIVTTSRMDVKVLGTCFDVKSYPEDEIVSVKVESGQVQVDLPDAMMRLKQAERFYLNTTSGKIEKQKEVTEKVAEWRRGILSFHSTPLYDVARELERHYQCKISFANGEIFDNLISGEHENVSLEDVLKSIEFVSCVKYIYKKETGEVLFSKK